MCSLPLTEMLGQCHTAIKYTLIIIVISWTNIYLGFSVLCLVYYCLLFIWVSDKVYAILLKIKVFLSTAMVLRTLNIHRVFSLYKRFYKDKNSSLDY